MELAWLALIIPGSYIILSIFFLCFPNIIHRKYRYKYPPFNDLVDSDQKFCIGHRGGSWQGPQNTMQLFQKNNNRVHMFQLDVCLTKDKKLVVHHDSSLSRTCGDPREVCDCDYADLPRFQEQFQSFMGPVLKSSRNKIILLQQLFIKFPEKPMNIELKQCSEEGIEEFNKLVRKFQRQDITVWGAAGSLSQKLRQSNPQTVCFYSAGEILKMFLLFITGLLPFVCIRHGVLDIPLVTQQMNKMASNFAQTKIMKCLVFFVFLILKCFNLLSNLFIPHLKKRGILTFYFILNHEEDFDSALNKGCQGIMTDLTEDLQKYLKNKKIFYQPMTGL